MECVVNSVNIASLVCLRINHWGHIEARWAKASPTSGKLGKNCKWLNRAGWKFKCSLWGISFFLVKRPSNKVANLTTMFSDVRGERSSVLNKQKLLLSVRVPVVTHFIQIEQGGEKKTAVLFQGKRSLQTDGLAVVLFCKVEAERQQHCGSSFMGYQ